MKMALRNANIFSFSYLSFLRKTRYRLVNDTGDFLFIDLPKWKVC